MTLEEFFSRMNERQVRYLDARTTVRCASGRHLLLSKLAANRPQDQLDIEFLREKERLGNLD